MTYLLDTNTCIKYLNGTSESIRLNLESRQAKDFVLCSVVIVITSSLRMPIYIYT